MYVLYYMVNNIVAHQSGTMKFENMYFRGCVRNSDYAYLP